MKKGFLIAFLLNLVILTAYFQKDIVNFITSILPDNKDIEQSSKVVFNKYKSSFDYMYVNNVTTTTPYNIDNLKNIYYTFIDSGMNEFTFYCPDEYESCTDDISSFSKEDTFLGALNNYVHPYNSYEYLATDIHNNKITLYKSPNYTKEMIKEINNKVLSIINTYITSDMSDYDKIKVIHDYIINNTVYDKTKSGYSHLAYGALIDHSAICGGYTDAMSIFLFALNIPNYKISTDEHIWNLVKLDNTWYHLDLTWDDPVNDIKDILSHNYFLITDKELKAKNDGEHEYDENVYLELK